LNLKCDILVQTLPYTLFKWVNLCRYTVDTPLQLPIPGGGFRTIAKRVWRFRSNKQYFGVTQYLDAFTEEESKTAMERIDMALYEEKKAYKVAKEALSAAEERGDVAPDVTLPPQLHISGPKQDKKDPTKTTGKENRFKIFYGYRYSFSEVKGCAEAKIPKLFADVPPIPDWLLGGAVQVDP
jgi:hypothetical protein